ncbi:MAG: DNA polymerase III subunit gamma/tau, partial [Myxococcales bacterium]|nr:DNA polymerase III subunit gamma/tau [Myxococcales bacterium]
AAVQLLAREAAGSMRDAMSLLDQVIAFSGEAITGDAVTQVLGVADRKVLHELGAALVAGDGAACLGVVDRLARQGFDLANVTRDVLRHLRDLVVATVCTGRAGGDRATLEEMLDLADEEVQELVALAARADADDLARLFQGFSQAYDDILRGGQPRIALEMTLVRLARRPPLLPIDELLSRLGDLERRLGGAPPPGPAPRGGGGGPAPQPVARVISNDAEPRGARLEGGSSARTVGSLALAESPAAPRSEPARPVMRAVPAAPSAAPPAMTAAPKLAPAPAPAHAAPAPPPARPAADPASSPVDVWRAILDRVRSVRPGLASVLEHGAPLEVNQARVVIRFDEAAEFLSARAREAEALDVLTREVRRHFGAETQVSLEARASPPPAAARTVASLDAERRAVATASARAAVEGHPVVQEAIRIFAARVHDVKLPNNDG